MAKPTRATQKKRERERNQKERQQGKHEQRAIRKDTRADRVESLEAGIDPDLVGIYPGPQKTADEEY